MKALKKIILTDDEEDIITIARFSFEMMPDVQVKFCHSGQETIQEALSFLPDLILLDVMMPNMDGLSTLQALKLMPSLAPIPVVFLTARSRKEEIKEYKRLGAFDIIPKPFDPMTLPQTIATIWEAYQSETHP